jgi:chromate reductase
MATTFNVISICGSLRKGSYNGIVQRALPALAPEGMTITPAPSFADFPVYNADIHHTTGFPAAVTQLADAMRAADGVVIVSPEYNWSIPGPLKNAIDWLSRVPNQPFKDKPVAILSASGGALGAARMQYHLRQSLSSIDALISVRPEVFVTFVTQKVDEASGTLKDEPTKDIIRQQLAAFAKFIRRMAPSP